MALSVGRAYAIGIEIKDTYGNSSVLSFRVQYQPPAAAFMTPALPGKKFYPGMVDGEETEDCAFYLEERSLYDSVSIATTVAGYLGSGLSLPEAVSVAQAIGAAWIALLHAFLVRYGSMLRAL